jgi:CRP-like cAMP-binding protein/rhodanese-related sulfurtransferase
MGEKDEIRAVISDCALFTGISQEAIVEIADIAKEITFPPNTTVFQQGDLADACYIIVSGAVKGFRKNDKGDAYELIHLEAGESFGEIALLTEKPRPLSVETVKKTHLLVISREDCIPILGKYPDVTAAIGSRVSQWLHKASAAVENGAARQYEAPGMSWLDFLIIVGLGTICALVFNASNPKGISLFPKPYLDESVSFVDPLKAFEKQKTQEVIFVDAMPSGFYEQLHIAQAVSLPLAIFDFMYDMSLSQSEKNKGIIVYGRTISKRYDEEVANKLDLRGHENVRILDGGLKAWEKGGFPVE